MSEEKPSGVTGTVGGWIKAVVTSVVGLVSGAFLMYLTPVINNAIKPGKPVANFAIQAAGLEVNFNNRSTGGVQGWWDFGDGAALEPFDPKLENVKHVYAKPGTYSVKLSLQNLLGEESDRTAAVSIDAGGAAQGPEIASFDLKPLDPRERAPAVYRLTGKVKNANVCILSYGDSKPTEVIDDALNHERYITFDETGAYTVRLTAVNGKQLVEQIKTVCISPNEELEPVAKLLVTYEAVKVERPVKDWKFHCGWHADLNASVSPFRRERLSDPGFTILSADLASSDDNAPVRNLKLQVAPDNSKAILSGELVRQTGLLAKKTTAPNYVAQVHVVLERRSPPQTINRGDVSMTVSLNRTTKVPMQPLEDGWEIVRKQVCLQLWDGARKAWEGSKAVTNAKVMLNNQTCFVTTTQQNDAVLLKIDGPPITGTPPDPKGAVIIPTTINHSPTPVGPVIRPAGFLRNPLLPKRPS
jgi:PKD repeat protein